ALLPPAMKEILETEKRLFAMIPKNDYGRGGAWDFYWGALYPRGGKRIESAQLYVWIGNERMEFGFTLGEYAGEQYDRFMMNIDRRHDQIVAALTPHIDTSGLTFGWYREGSQLQDEGRKGISIQEWFADIDELGASASIFLSKEEVLRLS